MSKNILITSINPGVGKTTYTLALALQLRREGKNVGYFKPITDNTIDTDARDAKALLQMKEDENTICPVLISAYEYDMTEDQRTTLLTKIHHAYKQLSENYDFLLIESCRRINYLSFLELSSKDLARELDAKVLILTEGREIEDVDRVLLGLNYFKNANIDVLGAIFTLVPTQLFSHFKTSLIPILENKYKINIIGIVPDKIHLTAPTVAEVASGINARIIAGENYLDKLIENYVVGAMNPESALKYFRRSINKAVITGGDRPQICIAAMETDTSALILTGGILPSARIIATAEEKKIPILLVNTDTFSIIKIVNESPVYGKLHVDQDEKLDAWNEILKDVDTDKLLEKL